MSTGGLGWPAFADGTAAAADPCTHPRHHQQQPAGSFRSTTARVKCHTESCSSAQAMHSTHGQSWPQAAMPCRVATWPRGAFTPMHGATTAGTKLLCTTPAIPACHKVGGVGRWWCPPLGLAVGHAWGCCTTAAVAGCAVDDTAPCLTCWPGSTSTAGCPLAMLCCAGGAGHAIPRRLQVPHGGLSLRLATPRQERDRVTDRQ